MVARRSHKHATHATHAWTPPTLARIARHFSCHVGMYICIHTYAVSYIHSFFVIFNRNVFSALHAKLLKYEKMFREIDEWIASQHDLSSNVVPLVSSSLAPC